MTRQTQTTVERDYTFEPNDEQRNALESIYYHLFHVYHNGAESAFGFHANNCDSAGVPMWAQNNASAMADERDIYFKNEISAIVAAACKLDWAPHVRR